MFKPDKLAEIRARWLASSHLERWRALEKDARFRAIGDIEETIRTVREADPELATSLTAALDALDAVTHPESIGGPHQTHEDIGWLLREIERLRTEIVKLETSPQHTR